MRTVFVVGAGPAGLFAAQKIAQSGHQVIIFNRDIKPGGLAEYGIYPTKDKMKVGLRKQFAKVLALPNVHYFGNVSVGHHGPLTLDYLKDFNPCAIVFAVGAQGTKQLQLEGSDAGGVYSAKDFVYYYNQLPPFAAQDFSTGKRVAVIGMGNVAVDIARWLLVDAPQKAECVTIVARRGPFEAKFDKKEFATVEAFLDREDFQRELKRIEPALSAVDQDISQLSTATFPILAKPEVPLANSRLQFRFLSTPQKIVPGKDGRIEKLILADNVLVKRDTDIGCKETQTTSEIQVDTMIFAIGDVVDTTVGLPSNSKGYCVNPGTSEQAMFEVFDPKTNAVVEGIFVVGWARNASEGLVGIARHDGESGAVHVLSHLGCSSQKGTIDPTVIKRFLESRGVRVVDKIDLEALGRIEEEQSKARGLSWFKFSDNEEMFKAIEQEKRKSAMTA